MDFYEKALEVGVQTYACIPMARFYRLLKSVEEARRDKIESSLGPNLCMLLEQVRISDKDSQPEDGAEREATRRLARNPPSYVSAVGYWPLGAEGGGCICPTLLKCIL